MIDVLLVEDDSWLADVFSRQLTTSGARVRVAHHAFDAIQCVDEKVPDVMVLDMLLPGANGMTLLHEITTHSDLKKMKIVVCTTLSGAKLQDLKPYGVVAVLDKSAMTSQEFVQTVLGAA